MSPAVTWKERTTPWGPTAITGTARKANNRSSSACCATNQGEPLSTEVFRGNTQDPATFASQVKKVSERFGCQRVTLVGDRGMMKSGQLQGLSQVQFHYITAITKPQIGTLLKAGVLQMNLFDAELCEVEHEGVRYVLRQNALRAEELS